jgi:spore maturation protein CgeB
MKLLIIGSGQPGHVGSYLGAASRHLGLDYRILDTATAHARSRIVRSFYWRWRDKRPARLCQFGDDAIASCIASQRDIVITTGCAPLNRLHIERLRELGVKVINYSTDDPWNPTQQADWFLSVLPVYEAVYTPRHANIDDFRRRGVRAVHYLPFACDPEVHRPWPDNLPRSASSDVLFVGGCDADRISLVGPLIDAGLDVALFGGYWGRYSKTRPYWRGIASQEAIRSASAAARICLCAVRRANRDGHTMRSFEAAAIGGCLLVEDTTDHRALFGRNDHAVRYFSSIPEMVQQAKDLVGNADTRYRLSLQLRETFGRERHSYAERLAAMLSI